MTSDIRVYPRWCGGNSLFVHTKAPILGLSPLVRGKHWDLTSQYIISGSIPAGAGETQLSIACSHCTGVYPRWCGGNFKVHNHGVEVEGLSPLVRGKHTIHCFPVLQHGSIPAGAGETW